MTWIETLPKEPTFAPTVGSPGGDITHWFELSIAPWFSMAMCDSNSYPLLPWTPTSDGNAPRCDPGSAAGCSPGQYPGAGGAFMEMQFYPPGFAPFADAISCDNTHWCSALNIDSLECTLGFASCNGGCIEPVNFAYIQRDGIPAGPLSPQETDLSTFTANAKTLLMNPGDRLRVHMFNGAVAGHPGQRAFEVVIDETPRPGTTSRRGRRSRPTSARSMRSGISPPARASAAASTSGWRPGSPTPRGRPATVRTRRRRTTEPPIRRARTPTASRPVTRMGA